MPRSAKATGNKNDSSHNHASHLSPTDHWLSDPKQISHWQGHLVDCCHAINLQLSQIQSELSSRENLSEAPATLRLIGASEPAIWSCDRG